MKKDIHPKWYPEAKWVCTACGTEWTFGATVQERRVDICANCHPFYTGEQRIVDTEGQVDRFYKRLQQRDQIVAQSRESDSQPAPTDVPVEDLDIGKRYAQILSDEGLKTSGDLVKLLSEKGDQALLDVSGIGRKILSDVKRKLRNLGFELTYELEEEQ
jgi:large subunit ribosomal protein L31